MTRKTMVGLAMLVAMVGWVRAESRRLLLSTENRMPALHQLEAGARVQYQDLSAELPFIPNREQYDVVPYLRYGLFRNLTIFTQVPYRRIQPAFGKREEGMGDVSAGFELVAYEDVFKFPYIIPHAELSFDTGDEKKGLGFGENRVLLGASIGTTVMDMFHYVVDVGYTICEDAENFAQVSAGFVWDLSKQFSLLVEGRAIDQDFEDKRYTLYGQAGMSYKATEALAFTVYGGAGDREDAVTALKVAYSF